MDVESDDEFEEIIALIDEEIDDIAALTQINAALAMNCHDRAPSIPRVRWNSEYLISLALNENSFHREYRMPRSAFVALHRLMTPLLTVNNTMAQKAMSRTGSSPISTESRLCAALIMLGGGRSIEAMRTHGLAKGTVYANFRRVIKAINKHPSLAVNTDYHDIPTLQRIAAGFQARSTSGLFRFCVGAIDGLLIRIRAPSKEDTTNQKRFFSRKGFFGLNMQAVCDADAVITAFSLKTCGSANDAVAFDISNLKEVCRTLPFPFHWISDLAYTATDQMMPPYPGINLHEDDPPKDWFNFWLSQLRITIERVFGMIVRRFGILWKPMEFQLNFVFEIVHACIRLHNFLVRHRVPLPPSPVVNGTTATTPLDAVNAQGALENPVWFQGLPPNFYGEHVESFGSTLREALLKTVTDTNMVHYRSHHL